MHRSAKVGVECSGRNKSGATAAFHGNTQVCKSKYSDRVCGIILYKIGSVNTGNGQKVGNGCGQTQGSFRLHEYIYASDEVENTHIHKRLAHSGMSKVMVCMLRGESTMKRSCGVGIHTDDGGDVCDWHCKPRKQGAQNARMVALVILLHGSTGGDAVTRRYMWQVFVKSRRRER